jgi:hypothetical protein
MKAGLIPPVNFQCCGLAVQQDCESSPKSAPECATNRGRGHAAEPQFRSADRRLSFDVVQEKT